MVWNQRVIHSLDRISRIIFVVRSREDEISAVQVPSDHYEIRSSFSRSNVGFGAIVLKNSFSNRLSPFTSKFDAFLAGKYTLTPDQMAGYNLFKGKANCNSCRLDGRSTANAGPDRHRRPGQYEASVQLLRLCQSRPAAQSQGCAVLSDHAGPLRIHTQSLWPRLQRFGIGHLSPKRLQSELAMGTICANQRRPDANLDGTQRGDDTATVPHH